MTRINSSGFLAKAARNILLLSAALCVFTATAPAEEINLTLQDAPLTIQKGASATKKINGVPANTPGRIDLRVKWHAMTFTPFTFNKLKIELLRGSSVVQTSNCYSVHSDKDPKCYVSRTISQAEASAAGDWKLRVTNGSDHDVNGFNIVKEITDVNPTVRNVESTFESDCSVKNLTLQDGNRIELDPNSSAERVLHGIPGRAGEVRIRAKWHTDVVMPNAFQALTVQVLYDGAAVKTDYGYSIHSDKADKLELKFNVNANQSALKWKLKISNGGGSKIKNFDIEKNGDLNPILSRTDLNFLVPQFKSTFTPACN